MSQDREFSGAKAALLAQWREGRRAPQRVGDRAITAGPPVAVTPVSFYQHHLLSLQRGAPPNASTTIAFAAFLPGQVDSEALAGAVEAVARRHETLRTTFHEADGRFWQHIGSEPLVRLEVRDLTGEGGDLDARAVEEARAIARRPFELAVEGGARVVLFRLAADRHLLTIAAHHTVADGWSLAVAMAELGELYDAATSDRAPRLQPLPIQYRDFARWQWEWLASPDRLPHLEYWKQQLRGLKAVRLPADHPEAERSLNAGTRAVSFSPSVADAVRTLAAGENVSVFVTLLASLSVLLRELTDSSDVVIGSAVANRTRPETHPLIGFFSSLVALRTDLSGNPSFREVVRRARDTAIAALAHEDLTLVMYLADVEPERNLALEPAYSATLVLQPPMPSFALGGIPLQPVEIDSGQSMIDFAVHLWNEESGIRGRVAYARDRFEASTVASWFERLEELIRRGAVDPDRRIAEL